MGIGGWGRQLGVFWLILYACFMSTSIALTQYLYMKFIRSDAVAKTIVENGTTAAASGTTSCTSGEA